MQNYSVKICKVMEKNQAYYKAFASVLRLNTELADLCYKLTERNNDFKQIRMFLPSGYLIESLCSDFSENDRKYIAERMLTSTRYRIFVRSLLLENTSKGKYYVFYWQVTFQMGHDKLFSFTQSITESGEFATSLFLGK